MSEVPHDKRPEYYKKEQPGPDGVVMLPPDHITYKARFKFDLKDRDGFILRSVETEPLVVTSGVVNNYQGVAAAAVSMAVARRTAAIGVSVHIVTCETCRPS